MRDAQRVRNHMYILTLQSDVHSIFLLCFHVDTSFSHTHISALIPPISNLTSTSNMPRHPLRPMSINKTQHYFSFMTALLALRIPSVHHPPTKKTHLLLPSAPAKASIIRPPFTQPLQPPPNPSLAPTHKPPNPQIPHPIEKSHVPEIHRCFSHPHTLLFPLNKQHLPKSKQQHQVHAGQIKQQSSFPTCACYAKETRLSSQVRCANMVFLRREVHLPTCLLVPCSPS
jgi:hypothetical protein